MRRYSAIPSYEKLGILGRGGTAEVHKVRLADGRLAALKIPLEQSAELSDLAQREWTLIGGHFYPFLIRLLAPPQDGNLLLELSGGPTLDLYRGKLSIAATMQVLSATAAALEIVHAHGIIHADLKTQNFFLPSVPNDELFKQLWFARLSDFSLGRLQSEPESSRVGRGTIGFMAPELVNGQPTSIATDLFAFGVLAYEMLTGVHPFLHGNSDPMVVTAKVCEGDIPAFSAYRNDIPHALESLVLSLLEREPEKRTPRALDVCIGLDSLGCTYPYRAALHPRWFPKSAVQIPWEKTAEKIERRLITSSSFRAGSLRYQNGHFQLSGQQHIPARTRRTLIQQQLIQVRKNRWGHLRNAVRCAAQVESAGSEIGGKRLGQLLLLQLLKPSTIRRVALNILGQRGQCVGPLLTTAEQARLSHMAGKYPDAARLAADAAIEWSGTPDGSKGIALLRFMRDELRFIHQPELVRDLCAALGNAYRAAGQLTEAEPEFLAVVDYYLGREPDRILADAHNSLGILYHQQERFDAGKKHLEQSLALYENFDEPLSVAKTHNNLGNLYWLIGDYAASLRYYRRALHLQRRLGAERETASTLNNAATVYCVQGRFDRAIRLFKSSLERNKELGIPVEIARTLNNLGFVYHTTGQGDRAVEVLSESLALNRHIGNQKEILFNLENLTSELISSGRLTDAEKMITEGRSLANSMEDFPHEAAFTLQAATVQRRRGNFQDAALLLERAISLRAEYDNQRYARMLIYEQCRLLEVLGEHERARSLAEELLADSQAASDETQTVNSLLLLARYPLNDKIEQLATKILAGVFLIRERSLYSFARLEFALTTQGNECVAEALNRCLALPPVTGIEALRCNLLIAEGYSRLGDVSGAANKLQQLRTTSEASLLQPEQIHYLLLCAEIAFTQKEYDVAFASIRKAVMESSALLASLTESERATFQSLPLFRRMSELVGLIKAKLKNKERAG